MTTPFVHLHNHSDHSALDGYARPYEYAQLAAELGQPAVGLTDHGTPEGFFEFYHACKQVDVTPILGVEAYLAPLGGPTAFPMTPTFYAGGGQDDVSGGGAYTHLTLWAYNATGVENLHLMHYQSNTPECFYRKNRIDLTLLASHAEGLIVATGCPSGEVLTRLRLGQLTQAYQFVGDLVDMMPGRVYVELMDHHMVQSLERSTLQELRRLSQKLNLPLVATNDCHYAHVDDAKAHEIMLAIQVNAKMDQAPQHQGGPRFAFDGYEYYLKTGQAMWELFPDDIYPGACTNTLAIAEMAQDIRLPDVDHPRPEPVIQPNEVLNLRHEAYQAIDRVYGVDRDDTLTQEIHRRIEEEIDVIESSDFPSYFFVVRDLIRYAQKHHSFFTDDGVMRMSATGPGRGSVGGSVIAYLLGISQVDPIAHQLLFSRFLTAGRGTVYTFTFDDGTAQQYKASDKLETPDGWRYAHEIVSQQIDTIYVHTKDNA